MRWRMYPRNRYVGPWIRDSGGKGKLCMGVGHSTARTGRLGSKAMWHATPSSKLAGQCALCSGAQLMWAEVSSCAVMAGDIRYCFRTYGEGEAGTGAPTRVFGNLYHNKSYTVMQHGSARPKGASPRPWFPASACWRSVDHQEATKPLVASKGSPRLAMLCFAAV